MALAAGTRLGPYEITAPLGAGGMGEVYRAHDQRLNRDVAIKVLAEGVAGDPDRRARLEREAQAVAALSHPNVLAIFDTGTHEGQLYVVTELLEGGTLRQRLAAGALPPRRAVEVAVEVARGLAAAHDKHLVHRDLKPENIFLLADGRVKILDFGLARQAPSAVGATETVAAVTDPHTVLGTVGYMAPEQVRNEALDGRADLFAFGAVLYEMFTGQRAFRRDTPAETMTAILREEPVELARLRADLPPALDRIVRHCLEKSPAERFQSARDVAFALEALSGSDTTSSILPVAPAQAAGRPARVLPWLITAAAVGALVIAIWLGWLSGAVRDNGRGGAPMAIGAAAQVTTEEGLEIDPALSPDGKLLAYAAGSAARMRIFVRSVGGGRTIQLSEGSDALEFQPRWSPDGNQILYLTPTGVYIAPALGGASQRVVSGAAMAAAWAPDGTRIAVFKDGSLSIAPLDGGPEHELGKHDQLYSCDWSRQGDWIACAYGNSGSTRPGPTFGNIAPSAITVVSAAGGAFTDVTDLSRLNQSPAWSPDGRELYFISNRQGPRDIFVLDMTSDGRAQGEPRRVTTGLNAQSISFSAGGQRLAYVAYSARANVWSLRIPSAGTVDTARARPITSGNQIVESMQVSRDGRWLLYDSTLHGNADIFRVPVGGGSPERLTNDPADEFAPNLSPDGALLAYHSWRTGSRDIFVKAADGGPAEQVTGTANQESYPAWSPDGRAIAFFDQNRQNGVFRGVFVVRRAATGSWGTPVAVRPGGLSPVWMSDRLIAFSYEDGLEVVDVESGGPPRVLYRPVSASDPRVERGVGLSADGRSLYFKNHDAEGHASIWVLPATGGRPQPLVRFNDLSRPSSRSDFAVGAGMFFFTLDDRQSDLWVAELARRR